MKKKKKVNKGCGGVPEIPHLRQNVLGGKIKNEQQKKNLKAHFKETSVFFS